MAKITIEGSIRPSAYLARGERAEVRSDDPTVEFLIAQGYVNVVDEETGQLEAPPVPTAPGKGASLADWQQFLTAQGVDYPTEGEGSKRDDLVELWNTPASSETADA